MQEAARNTQYNLSKPSKQPEIDLSYTTVSDWRTFFAEIGRVCSILKLANLEQFALSKEDEKPGVVDRFWFWLSTSRWIDGLWIGTIEEKPHLGLRRVEEALELIKRHDPLQYARVTRHLERVWVHLLPNARAQYNPSLKACELDYRYLLSETMTLEEISSTIVHEATHGRLARWGIEYIEDRRTRIEAVCIRRELSYIAKLPNSDPLKTERANALEWCIDNRDYFSDASFHERAEQEHTETLRYLEIPDWFIRFLLKMLTTISELRKSSSRLAGRFRGRSQGVP